MDTDNIEQELQSIERQIIDRSFSFPEGIIGFQESKRFVFAQAPEERPFAWMRSVDDPNLIFAVVDAFYLKPDYTVDIDDRELLDIGSPNPMDCFILFIIRVEPGPPLKIHANLRAPLILNRVARMGKQVIVSSSPYTEDEVFSY